MKNTIKYLAQRILGFNNYLFLFSIFTIRRLHRNKDEREFLHFLNIIPNKGIILDIGANIGITTVPLAQKLDKAEIYSFEPMPENLRALKRVIRYFKLNNVTLIETALGEEASELKMVMPVINHVKMQGLSHIYQEDAPDDPWNQGEIFTVPVQKLDDTAQLQETADITAIKIDVENFEYPVLKGARRLIEKHRPLIYCELWDNDKRALAINYLKEMRYSVKVFNGQDLTSYTGQDVYNFFFIPETD